MYASRAASSGSTALSKSASSSARPETSVQTSSASSAQTGGDLELLPVRARAAERPVDELVDLHDGRRRRVADHCEVERVADVGGDAGPVVEHVLVPDERPRALAGRALGEEHLVDPAGRALDVALPVAVRPLLAVDHRRGVPQDGHELRRGAHVLAALAPQRQEPREPRVLDDDVVGLRKLGCEPLAELPPDVVVHGDAGGLRPGGRPPVGDLNAGPAEERRVEVDDPFRLGEAAWIRAVGGHLRLRDVETEALHDPGEEARPAAA